MSATFGHQVHETLVGVKLLPSLTARSLPVRMMLTLPLKMVGQGIACPQDHRQSAPSPLFIEPSRKELPVAGTRTYEAVTGATEARPDATSG